MKHEAFKVVESEADSYTMSVINELYFQSRKAAMEYINHVMNQDWKLNPEFPEWQYNEYDGTEKWWVKDWIDGNFIGAAYAIELSPIEIKELFKA
jgi:hypothetical protein